jgi:hypothetical protein
MDDILSAKSMLETDATPRITYGGQSSSKALNAINENARNDMLALGSDVANYQSDVATTQALLSCQASAIGAAVANISDLLLQIRGIYASGAGRAPVDMFDDRYVVTEETTADVNTVFGQATLGISGSSDWLVARDTEGGVWIPSGTKIRYACNGTGSNPNGYGGDPTSVSDYIEDPEFTSALDGDPGTMWVVETDPDNDYIFIEIQVPVEVMTNGRANTLVLRPFPVLCHDLISVDIISQSGNAMTLSGSKLSYLPGYSITANCVKTIGDTRVFFPPTQVAAVRIKLKAGSFAYWGFSEISLKTTSFMATSKLSLDLTAVGGSKDLTAVTLKGDNPTSLATIPSTINGSKVSYNLTQQDSGYSPVITLLDTTWE